jgi:hypothetical protein
MLPAWEWPIWRCYYEQEPWGFKSQDMLLSKAAMQISQASAKLKPGVTYKEFMFRDRFESGDLTDNEYKALSAEEKNIYLNRQISALRRVLT